MSFDISRSSFRPRKNFLGVVMQQGRVQLDSDWNEWQSEYARRLQAGTLDAIGQAVYPASTPNAFQITTGTNASGNTLYIGAGRYYVDGLLAENHGPEGQAVWDDALGEMSGAPAFATTNTAQTDYMSQPYLPNPTLPASGDVCVAYLDVWQRDVTYLEDSHLIDKAVNIDTTGRLQTVWQVKLLDLGTPSSIPDCSTDVPAFDALSLAPAGRLTTGLVPNASSGPCCLSPNTGFTGQENQMYRVEIHSVGTPGAPPEGGYTGALPADTPTFKWSRDNASVQTSVSAISTVSTSSGSVSQITVASLGRDQVLGFAVNDWIEITDEVYELNNEPGEIYQITGVTAASNVLTLSGSVSGHFPLNGGQTNPKLHTRITRWDQSGQVYSTDSSGNLTAWYDLSASGAVGVIPVPPTGTTLVLENGVTVSFDLSPESTSANPTAFRIADYWLFTARAADGSVETLKGAPPLGVNHHYAKLAIVTFPSTISPCRVEWPPAASGSGSCCCSVTVSATDLTGDTTLQSIVSNYQNALTPVTICLEPGTYPLSSPLRLTSAYSNITIEACQASTVILQALAGNESQFNDGLIVLDGSTSITLSGFTLQVPSSQYQATTFAGLATSSLPSSVASMVQNLAVSIGVRIVGGNDISVENCNFLLADSKGMEINDNSAIFAAGILLNGVTVGLNVQGCDFKAGNLKFWMNAQSRSMAHYTGVAMASSVTFAAPAPSGEYNFAGGRAEVDKNLSQFQDEAVTDATPQAKAAAKPKIAKRAVAKPDADLAASGETLAKNSPTVNLNTGEYATSIASGTFIQRPGLQNIGGVMQNIYNFGNSTPTALAAQGGTVLTASLDQAVITGNTFANLTSAALLLGDTAALTTSDNQVSSVAGFWVIVPSQVQTLLNDPQSLALLGATVAFSMPLPQGDTSEAVTVQAASPSVFLYTGTDASGYTDSNGNVWLPDTSVSSVTINPAPSPSTDWLYAPSPAPSIYSTADPTLYQTERAGPSFSYTFSELNAGFYNVTLDFAEIFYTAYPDSGIRVFDVSINNVQVLTNFDIGAAAGALTADQQIFSGVPSSNGQIIVQFTGTYSGSDHNAKINALSVTSVSSGAPYLGTGNESESTLFFDQLAQIAWQGFANAGGPARWRFDGNEMQGLNATAILLLDDDNVFNENSSSLMLTGNRIDGDVEEQQYFNEADDTKALLVATKDREWTNEGITTYQTSFTVFVALVSVSGVSRAVITSNMVTNLDTSQGSYGECLIVFNSTVQEALVTIMSNVFAGYIEVPNRNLGDSTLDSYAQSWFFLNTMIDD